jgi:hypothetical protein
LVLNNLVSPWIAWQGNGGMEGPPGDGLPP